MSGEAIFPRPIGVVRSEVKDPGDAPHQGRDAGVVVRVEVFPPFQPGLAGLAPGMRLLMVCWLDRARRDALMVHPQGDPQRPLTGVFNTRSPNRPNPLAVYAAELVAVEGGTLTLRGVDAVEGTPVLDLKPHIPRLDG